MDRCNSIDALRTATKIYVDGLDIDQYMATLLLPAVRKMTLSDERAVVDVEHKGKLRTDAKNLPVELLPFLRRGGIAEAKMLLAAIKNKELTDSFVSLYGREA